MKKVNIHEAKTHLSRLVEMAAAGEEIVIAKAGRAVARLVPMAVRDEPRRLGALEGQGSETEGWWQSNEDIDALFYGENDGSPA
jgi:prevent-host-death family protein